MWIGINDHSFTSWTLVCSLWFESVRGLNINMLEVLRNFYSRFSRNVIEMSLRFVLLPYPPVMKGFNIFSSSKDVCMIKRVNSILIKFWKLTSLQHWVSKGYLWLCMVQLNRLAFDVVITLHCHVSYPLLSSLLWKDTWKTKIAILCLAISQNRALLWFSRF